MSKYGLWDIKSKAWLGRKGEDIPILVEHEDLAQALAMTAAKSLGFSTLRIRAREFNETALCQRGELETVMTPQEALQHLENGGL